MGKKVKKRKKAKRILKIRWTFPFRDENTLMKTKLTTNGLIQ